MRRLVFLILVLLVPACTVNQRRHGVGSSELNPEAAATESGRLLCDLTKPQCERAWKLYAIQDVANRPVLSSHQGALRVASTDAAGLFYLTGAPLFEPRKEPLLAWRWRVSALLEGTSPLAPDFDNFPARLLVGFDCGWEGADALALQWKKKVEDATGMTPPPRAICYTFGGALPAREAVDALFGQGRIVVINLRGRDAKADCWYSEIRDVASDYRAVFGEDAPAVTALAIASDTHRVHATVKADFADFRVFDLAAYPRFAQALGQRPEREASTLALWLATGCVVLATLLAGAWLWRTQTQGQSS